MLVDNIFMDIGLIIIIATMLAFLAKLLKQPLIPAYVLTGLLLGPIYEVITNKDVITTLSEMGIAFLLFIVGMEMDLTKLKSVGLVASLGGITQSVTLFSIGFMLMLFMGFRQIEAAYVGVIIAFSSTMVVIKLLSDKRELDTLHGRIVIGFLLMEDLLAITALSVMASMGNFSVTSLVVSLMKAALLFVVAWAANKLIFPKVFKFAAQSTELLFLSATTALFLFSLFFASLSFSISVGAFVAGIALANLPYTYEIIGKIKSMRDFFSTIFFVSLGMSIVRISKSHAIETILLIIVILFIKPLITIFITTFFGYKRRPAFLTAISLAQTSEFSLIIAAVGINTIGANGLPHISNEIFSMTAIIAVLTMSITPYYLKYEYIIYSKLSGFLKKFDSFSDSDELELASKDQKYDVLLIGYDRIGYSIMKKLHILKKKLIVVDFNPEVIKRLIKQNIHCMYGDISDTEIIERINLKQIAMVISTSPDKRDNMFIIQKAKEANPKAMVFVTAYKVEDALELYDSGADYVILPHFLGGDHVSILIEKFGDDINKLITHKLSHIEELKNRQSLGHNHPVNHHLHSEG